MNERIGISSVDRVRTLVMHWLGTEFTEQIITRLRLHLDFKHFGFYTGSLLFFL